MLKLVCVGYYFYEDNGVKVWDVVVVEVFLFVLKSGGSGGVDGIFMY